MKALVIYDSVYGNTEQVARAVGKGLEAQGDVALVRVGDVKVDQLRGVDLIIVGSPTQRFNTMPAISNLLKGLPKDSLKGVKVAAFDTRLSASEINKTPVLAFFVKLWGKGAYAAKPIADLLRSKGGKLNAPPEGFLVEGTEGPLVPGELNRAEAWAKQISNIA